MDLLGNSRGHFINVQELESCRLPRQRVLGFPRLSKPLILPHHDRSRLTSDHLTPTASAFRAHPQSVPRLPWEARRHEDFVRKSLDSCGRGREGRGEPSGPWGQTGWEGYLNPCRTQQKNEADVKTSTAIPDDKKGGSTSVEPPFPVRRPHGQSGPRPDRPCVTTRSPG